MLFRLLLSNRPIYFPVHVPCLCPVEKLSRYFPIQFLIYVPTFVPMYFPIYFTIYFPIHFPLYFPNYFRIFSLSVSLVTSLSFPYLVPFVFPYLFMTLFISLFMSHINFPMYVLVYFPIKIPVVPARGGAEVALKIYIYKTLLFSSIELACAVRQPSPCVRALCETGVLFHMSHLKLHFTLHT